ncbi:DUF4350 domain-containing protein [Crateriforma conspicua]|uniref:DUF4350 domain-containing protein n=1 Tax=Crateriforma conspicua TaxID=2527996 RepID=A0A5C5Y1Y2_9PLAN|nr:DUF4350 domain-containing protein [Crateriforma conspicua]TWT69170.1 hypothetical protein Pan14r_14550 [Crateriforma conspicua]
MSATKTNRSAPSRSQTRWSWAIAALLVLSTGCDYFDTTYGPVKGYSGGNSINGFGGFRSAIESKGVSARKVYRLSQRTGENDVLVWIPQTMSQIPSDATTWFNRWLRKGNHTLVYVIPDSGSEVEYWQQTRQLCAPADRLTYRRELAKATNLRLEWRLNRRDLPSNGWFQTFALESHLPCRELTGPWSADLAMQSADDSDLKRIDATEGASLGVEFRLDAFDAEVHDKIRKNVDTDIGATGPSSQYWTTAYDPGEIESDTSFQPLLQNQDGVPLVGVVRKRAWADSKIIVVAGGSLLTNFAMTSESNRQLAYKIVDEALASIDSDGDAAPGRVGMLVSETSDVIVSESSDGPPVIAGMQLLSTWPLSLITIHATLLGVIACLALLPIFGRPRRMPQKPMTDFGDHLDAVSALMTKTAQDGYALDRLAEYQRTVHGETSLGEAKLAQAGPVEQANQNNKKQHV